MMMPDKATSAMMAQLLQHPQQPPQLQVPQQQTDPFAINRQIAAGIGAAPAEQEQAGGFGQAGQAATAGIQKMANDYVQQQMMAEMLNAAMPGRGTQW